ncbi:dynactin subunit 2 [Venturia canescens]|uniref:dynactin subunit 2 n=1 Tax=Venturia canescens TaxID=32260 RepID=UPI001C9C3AC4|nr:dynactin subunit 2 [Venturia canescens]
MADPKYADLPGIAYDQADVYETSDLPEAEQLPIYAEDETDSIERLHTSATEAFNKFKGKRVLSQGVDFSDRISRKPRTGYNSVFGDLELPGEGEQETPIQKSERLQFELKELFEEVNTLKEKTNDEAEQKSVAELLSQVETMGKQLNCLKLEETLSSNLVATLADPQGASLKQLMSQIELFKQTGSTKVREDESEPTKVDNSQTEPGILKYQMMYLPEKARLQESQRIAGVEQRIARLENVLGASNEKLGKFSQTLKTQGIVEAVQQLCAKSALLDSTQIEAMTSRLSTLSHRMDNLAQKKSAAQQDTEREQKIVEMYEIMKKIEASSDIVPQTVNRMLALSSIHQQAAEFGKSLAQLELLQTDITNGLDSNKALLKGVQESFASNLESIRNNLASLDERVKKLNK